MPRWTASGLCELTPPITLFDVECKLHTIHRIMYDTQMPLVQLTLLPPAIERPAPCHGTKQNAMPSVVVQQWERLIGEDGACAINVWG